MFGSKARPAAASDPPADVDYRLARNTTLREWRAGEIGLSDICDAQRELIRTAVHCGARTRRPCPVCADGRHDNGHAPAVKQRVVEVTYVFGYRLPAHGRCVTSDAEMRRLQARIRPVTGYVIEVCTACGWNYLIRRMIVGGAAAVRNRSSSA